jgi:hypothetical protein
MHHRDTESTEKNLPGGDLSKESLLPDLGVSVVRS